MYAISRALSNSCKRFNQRNIFKAGIKSMTVIDLLDIGKTKHHALALCVSDGDTILDAMKRMAENEV